MIDDCKYFEIEEHYNRETNEETVKRICDCPDLKSSRCPFFSTMNRLSCEFNKINKRYSENIK